MTFTAKTKNAEDWKAIVGAISTIADECTFQATPEGLAFRMMDPSHVALVDVFWPKEGFESYECDSTVKFGLWVNEFSKLLKRADKKDTVTVSLSKEMLQLQLSGDYERKYEMKLIETSASDTPLQKLDFKAKVVTPVSMFDKLISDVQVVSEYVIFASKKNSLTVEGKGDSGEAKIELSTSTLGIEEISAKEESKAAYSIDYISKIVKAVVSAGGSVAMEYSSKMPCRLEFPVANVGRIHFYLAPRVSDD